MRYDFSDKVAIVTGSTGGIGIVIVKQLIQSNVKVVAFGTNADKLKELNSEYDDKIKIVACDIQNSEQIKEEIKKTQEEFGKIDFLVYNAGITKDCLTIRMKDEDWDSVININLKGAFIFNREVIKIMSKQSSGTIINIASIVGLTGNIGQANYSASKGGMISMTKSLALEYASRNIRVNAIAPGFIETPMTEKIPEKIKIEILDKIPLKKYGSPNDIANAVMFLLSDDSSYITGTVLNVNGGMLM